MPLGSVLMCTDYNFKWTFYSLMCYHSHYIVVIDTLHFKLRITISSFSMNGHLTPWSQWRLVAMKILEKKKHSFTFNCSVWPPSSVNWPFSMFLNGAVTTAVSVCICVCSQWMVIEVIRVTLPELCAGSIIQSSYQQCKLHFPSRSDNRPIGSGKVEWSRQAWPGISKRYTLIV